MAALAKHMSAGQTLSLTEGGAPCAAFAKIPNEESQGMRRCYYSGTESHPVYVDLLMPELSTRPPVVMLHGGCHTGSCYLSTPDGREGWAPRFARAGHPVHVVDWPGHGRSPMGPDFARLSGHDVIASVAALLETTGPAILLAHSASGPFVWALAEQVPDKVLGIVGVAPGGPANLLPDLPDDAKAIEALRYDEAAGCPVYCPQDAPFFVNPEFVSQYWITGTRFPRQAMPAYVRSIVAESPRLMNERFNIGGRGIRVAHPDRLHAKPVLVLTGEHDPRHPRVVDEATARFVGGEFLWLPDLNIRGNGHMVMLEDNSDDIADLILDWIDRTGLCA